MSALSRTAEKCRKCTNMKNCNNKRLEACALAEVPKEASISLTTPLTGLSGIQLSNTIHIGEYGDMYTKMEEINKKIAKSIIANSCYYK